MLDQQKDWTFNFENEVLQTPGFSQDLPIKSNRTFLLEMWNILYHLYSTEVLKDFSIKNAEIFSQELINSISFSQLFKPEFLIPSKNSDGMDYNSFLSSNPLKLSTLESFKNLSKNFGNMQYSYNNTNAQTMMNYDLSAIKTYNNLNYLSSNLCNNPNNLGVLSNMNTIKESEGVERLNKIKFLVKKGNSETSSISVQQSENQLVVKPRVPLKLFQTQNNIPNNSTYNDRLVKKRKRYIKNNKFVYVFPDSALGRKLEQEMMMKEKMKESDMVKLEEENEEVISDLNINIKESAEEEMSEASQKGKKPRGSRYRGVSRNGNQWQVLIMVNKKKRYVGSYSNEEEAARAYDKVALQNHGTKAKTNFDYLDEEVKKILLEPPILKVN